MGLRGTGPAPDLKTRVQSAYAGDTIADSEKAPEAESGSGAAVFEWARLDSNQGPTDMS